MNTSVLHATEANSESSLLEYINSLPNNTTSSFVLRPVTYSEVFKLLTTMRIDCSTGLVVFQITIIFVKESARILKAKAIMRLGNFHIW